MGNTYTLLDADWGEKVDRKFKNFLSMCYLVLEESNCKESTRESLKENKDTFFPQKVQKFSSLMCAVGKVRENFG